MRDKDGNHHNDDDQANGTDGDDGGCGKVVDADVNKRDDEKPFVTTTHALNLATGEESEGKCQ